MNEERLVRPVFFRVYDAEDKVALERLRESGQVHAEHDTILSQLKELAICRHPEWRLQGEELDKAVAVLLDGKKPEEYGVWVFYPWSGRLVHLLDEQEFAELRTNRNKVKITAEEQTALLDKKIALIGLSVGQSVALTLAMQRGFGELRLADFDQLELSNLNRIRAGVHNLGLPKVTIVAREIAEIDPFLRLRCYWDGVNEENLEDFLLGDGKVDLLIDECDSISMKIRARMKARSHGIPVIMETSDRGMLDVERFDLEADSELFHGRLGSDEEVLKDLKADPMGLTMRIIDVANVSERGELALELMGIELVAWPQLAEDVFLGGATASKASRKILLNQTLKSGRYYIDANEIITGK